MKISPKSCYFNKKANVAICFLLVVFTVFQCRGMQIPSERLKSTENTMIYSLEPGSFYLKFRIPHNKQTFPFAKDRFMKISASLLLQKEGLTDKTIRVLGERDVTESIFPAVSRGKVLYIITMRPDQVSPFTRIYRSSFYIFWDGDSLNFVFVEVEQNLDFQNQFVPRDWNNPGMFEIKPLEAVALLEQGEFIHHKINNQVYGNWLKIPREMPVEEDSLEERLNRLKILYEKGLIDEKSYRKKIEELLKNL